MYEILQALQHGKLAAKDRAQLLQQLLVLLLNRMQFIYLAS